MPVRAVAEVGGGGHAEGGELEKFTKQGLPHRNEARMGTCGLYHPSQILPETGILHRA